MKRFTLKNSLFILGLTLLLGAVFKLSAFAREAFITSRFGLSPVTDTYFALQQLPVTAAAYMFGPFARAFTPAWSDSYRKEPRVAWFPGLMFYSISIGLALTALSFVFAPGILRALTRSGSCATLAILSVCYVPIVLIGLRAAIWTSYGRNLWSLTLTGLPYLIMTIALIGMYLAGSMGNLSLATSMTAGFAGVGLVSLIALLWKEKPFQRFGNMVRPWKFPEFRKFSSQLGASSIETIGFSASQFLMLYFMARAGTGAISANNCATRIGMLGYSLFAQPMVQLLQARLCAGNPEERARLGRRYVGGLALGAVLFAIGLYVVRYQVVSLVYLRGNFSAAALEEVVHILPAWLCYFVVLCLNTIISQYMFHASKGIEYTRNMLIGYLGTNILRFATADTMGASWIIWCAVIAEGGAFLANVLTSAGREVRSPAPINVPYGQEV